MQQDEGYSEAQQQLVDNQGDYHRASNVYPSRLNSDALQVTSQIATMHHTRNVSNVNSTGSKSRREYNVDQQDGHY